jgi:pyridine nucleotide-disulfide oxidoreductase family protein
VSPPLAPRRLLLIGGGHSHVEVLRRFALAPERGVDLVLVSPDALTPYSGMLPGLVAGHYTLAESHIDLQALAQRAGARFVRDRVVALDVAARQARPARGPAEPFDVASIDIGSTPDASTAGVREHAVGVKPVDGFLAAWEGMRRDAEAGAIRSIAVVGGGAGGVEILLAMQHRLRQACGDRAPAFALVSDQPRVLPLHAPAVGRRLTALLAGRGVVLHLGSRAVGVGADGVRLESGAVVRADRVVWATSAAAAPWLAASGLACDERGFLRVNAFLQSISAASVFATGDCAAQDGEPRPKSGVYAVRQGPPLATNLRRAVRAEPLTPYVPQRDALALIATGDRHAIGTRGGFTFAGRWVWRWKDRIDRRFMAQYRFVR